MEIKVSRRWQWWSRWCFGDGGHKHKKMMTISYHLYWLHVMFILYASYLALFDGSILRWSLTKFQGISVLPEFAPLRQFVCRDTTWWSGVISSTFTYNGCKLVLHVQNTRVNLTSLAYVDMASEQWDQKVERESYSRYDQHRDVHHWKLLHLTWWSDMV